MGFYTHLAMFLLGVKDSISVRWIPGVLFYTDPSTKQIMKNSIQLQQTLIRSFIQVGVILTFIPLLFKYFGFQVFYWVLTIISLIFTYAYLVFYNSDVTSLTKKIILSKTSKHPELMPELDVKQRRQFFTDVSNQLQSIIFILSYYLPVNIALILLNCFDISHLPKLLVIANVFFNSFFNSTFYFFRRWHYDRYNVAFLAHHLFYNVGFGMFVTVVSDLLLPKTLSTGAYMMISQFMIINALLHSPPQDLQFSSFTQIISFLRNFQSRNKMKNAYNNHRKMLENASYRQKLLSQSYFLKPFFNITSKINYFIAKSILSDSEVKAPPTDSFSEDRYSCKLTESTVSEAKDEKAFTFVTSESYLSETESTIHKIQQQKSENANNQNINRCKSQ